MFLALAPDQLIMIFFFFINMKSSSLLSKFGTIGSKRQSFKITSVLKKTNKLVINQLRVTLIEIEDLLLDLTFQD